jgi:hypothetical protein
MKQNALFSRVTDFRRASVKAKKPTKVNRNAKATRAREEEFELDSSSDELPQVKAAESSDASSDDEQDVRAWGREAQTFFGQEEYDSDEEEVGQYFVIFRDFHN